MTFFKCPKCGAEFKKTGYCNKCKIPLERACPYCNLPIERCTCTVPSTKDRPR